MNISVVDVDADGGAYLVEALDACGTWIDGEHVVFLVEDDFEDVGVAADEDVGQMGVDKLEGLVVVPAGIASDVHHQHPLSPALEKLCVRDSAADLRAVAVAVDSFERLEIRNLQQSLLVAEVPRVPYLVHRLEELFQRVVEPAVGV